MMNKEEQARLRQEWATPDDFFSVVDEEFQFNLDAAATKHNRKCTHFIPPRVNALHANMPWVDELCFALDATPCMRIWLNPGFAKVGPWMEKAHNEAQKHPSAVVVVMALIAPSAKWWRDWAMKASEIRLLGGRRVQFVAPEGIEQSSNARENCLIIFRPNPYGRKPDIWTWDWGKGL